MLRLTLRLTLLSIFSAHTRTLSSGDVSGFVALVTLFNFPYEIFTNLCVCVFGLDRPVGLDFLVVLSFVG